MRLIIEANQSLVTAIEQEFLKRNRMLDMGNFVSTYDFVALQISKMPDYLRLALNLLTIIFIIISFVRFGRIYQNLASDQQLLLVSEWRSSTIIFKRDFIRFFESFVIFDLTSKL